MPGRFDSVGAFFIGFLGGMAFGENSEGFGEIMGRVGEIMGRVGEIMGRVGEIIGMFGEIHFVWRDPQQV